MPETYLQTAYKDHESVKGLGARWDPARKQWYVPEGRDLAPFAAIRRPNAGPLPSGPATRPAGGGSYP